MIWWLWGHRSRVGLAIGAGVAWSAGWPARVMYVGGLAAIVWYWNTDFMKWVRDRERTHLTICRIRWRWASVTAGAGLERKGQQPEIVGRIRRCEGGVTWRVRPAPGQHAQNWVDQEAALCHHWLCSEIEIVPVFDRRGRPTDLLRLTASLFGVLMTKIDWPLKTPANPSWGRSAIPVGQYGGGRQATIDLESTPHMLIGGPPGGGKSSLLHTILCGLGLLPDEQLVLLDLKGVDLEPWRDRAETVVHTPQEATQAIAWCLSVMDSRFKIMREARKNKWVCNPDGPHITIVVDEFAELPTMLYPSVDKLARLSRAAGMSLIICTQRPAAELGPYFTRIRSMTTVKIAMGGLVASEARMILGEGGMPASWTPNPPGVGALMVGARTKLFRAYWSEDVVESVVKASRERRPVS